MQDGNNLFDEALSFAGEWRVDESMTLLAKEGIEAIIVGVSNIDGEPFGVRQEEYSPFVGEGGRGGKGDAYLDFLVTTLKPLVDSSFRTLPDSQNTGIAGSSLGAYISLYALYARPETFGFAAAFSPYLGFSRELRRYIARTDVPEPIHKIYLDVGALETGDTMGNEAYVTAVVNIAILLEEKGAKVNFLIDPNGEHNEASWSLRFPDALRWLLSD